MPTFKDIKTQLRSWMRNVDWSAQNTLPSDMLDLDPKKLISPLIACLPEEKIVDRSAFILGYVMNHLFMLDAACARNIMRRLIWQMNEESGNVAWGIPLAFGQILAQNRTLADEYHRILFHYVFEKEGGSNYCDFPPLRHQCYLAIDVVLETWPDLAVIALPLLKDAAINDQDPICRDKAGQSCALAEQGLIV